MMGDMKAGPAHLEVVELREARGEWPAGTVGTVVEASDEGALVEIADEEGRTLELLTVPYESLRRLESGTAKRRAAG